MKRTAALFKAFGDETRLKMLWLLVNHRELCVCDFMEVLQITQSKASRHLRALYHAGLVDDRREGLWVYYALRSSGGALAGALSEALRVAMIDDRDGVQLLADLESWLMRKGDTPPCAKRVRQGA